LTKGKEQKINGKVTENFLKDSEKDVYKPNNDKMSEISLDIDNIDMNDLTEEDLEKEIDKLMAEEGLLDDELELDYTREDVNKD